MPIDSSIYFQQQTPDFVGSIEKGMRMSDMLKQRRESDALKQAYQAGVVTNPDGTTSLDGAKTLSALAKGGFHKEAQDYQNQMRQQAAFDAEQQEIGRKRKTELFKNVGETATKLMSIQDPQAAQNEWSSVRLNMINTGVAKPQDLPEDFQSARPMVDFYHKKYQRTLQQEDLESRYKQAQINELDAKAAKERALGGKPPKGSRYSIDPQTGEAVLVDPSGATTGWKAVDRDFAKDYNEWTSGGADVARSEISKLRNVTDNLRDGKVATGGMTGLLGDRFTSNNVLSARADVQSTVMNSLRAILGAQFTEKEGERIIANTWNEADSTENNLARLERLVGDLEAKAAAKNSKTQYFGQYGTLAGFEGTGRQNASRGGTNPSRTSGSSGVWGINEAQAGQQAPRTEKPKWAK